ncbi:MAG: hypothetical protein BJ554DRAFT_5664 [Olpidium bornovanus]|uniref:Uncharacterized protein n=1 Tax=Olpidium bornovanus TaxID=278681 RepID=A0A8H8DLB8_9FUNG|nr:MAG: hypothetical protein BJ554DRAFT_5664 [Olpidium bornovanus]
MEPDAASRCESYLLQAAAVDASNPEVYQTLASVRLSQERHADARAAVAQSIQIWKDLEKGANDPAIPSYESRINLVKILLELSQCREALFVLGRLQEEDEKVVDLWYLFGYTYYLLAVDGETGELPAAPDNTVSPQFAADGEGAGCSDPAAVSPAAAVRLAWDFFRSTLKWHRELDSGDIGILEHTRELMASIRSVLPDVEEGEEEEPEEDEDRDEQGTDDGSEWENLSDDEGDDMVDA